MGLDSVVHGKEYERERKINENIHDLNYKIRTKSKVLDGMRETSAPIQQQFKHKKVINQL